MDLRRDYLLWPDILPIFMAIKQVIMSLYKLANLRAAIPDELYDIEPGQVAYFVSKDGVDKQSSKTLSDLFRFFTGLKKKDVRIRVIPTDNEILIGNIACRNIEEISIPYKIVVGPWETIVGLISEYYRVEWGDIMNKVPSMGPTLRLSVSDELPLVFPINPDKRPVKKSSDIGGETPDDFSMGWLKKRPETEKEKAEKIQQNEDKIRKILWECAYLGIDIDLKGLVEAVEASNSRSESYELSLKVEPAKAGRIDCKIYLGENLKLKLTAIQKAIYLTFLSLKDGLVIEEAKPDFTKRIQNIYRLLPDRSEKDDGILHVTYIQPQTLRGVISEVNAVIARLIPGGVGLEFAIEGEKNNPYKVMRSTPEIRKQIISTFSL